MQAGKAWLTRARAVARKMCDCLFLPRLPGRKARMPMLDLPALCRRLAVSRSTVYRLVATGALVRPIQVSPRRVAWPTSEIDAYVASLIAARDKGGQL